MKTCNICNESKTEDEFYRSLGRLRRQCKTCLKLKQAAARFGISFENLVAMYDAQGHACKICQQRVELVIDHDHSCCPYDPVRKSRSCGKCVRGLLCHACNHGLGNFRDDPNLLEAAVAYLRN